MTKEELIKARDWVDDMYPIHGSDAHFREHKADPHLGGLRLKYKEMRGILCLNYPHLREIV